MTVEERRGTRFALEAPGDAPVTVPAGAARDRFGNTNAEAIRLR